MSDNNQVTGESIKLKAENAIRKGKLSSLEAKVKKIVEEIDKAEDVVDMKKQELLDLLEDNSKLLNE